MIAAILIIALVVAVGAISWATRNARNKPTCCNPGQWPPDDITERADRT
ncbi:MAG: hypothetical protein KGR19_07780 [Acidobacteria bacterium]|nr:hypothetical protein [Acidobacteriota bacterium]